MSLILIALLIWSLSNDLKGQSLQENRQLDFIGASLSLPASLTLCPAIDFHDKQAMSAFDRWMEEQLITLIPEMQELRNRQNLCDWFYYQLIRRVADRIIPKSTDYHGYTMAKWHLLRASGFEPLVVLEGSRIWLYIRTEDIVYNLPGRMIDGKQFICINAHDYGFDEHRAPDNGSRLASSSSTKSFRFGIDKLPEFPTAAYENKSFAFHVGKRQEKLDISLNTALPGLLKNYPVTDYRHHFNIPLSKQTHASIVSQLREKLARMDTHRGIEYLLQFTRHAFPFAADTEVFGRERRYSPEETLLYQSSDCEDRAALFFYLVRELYDLPMVVLTFPNHVSVAVDLKDNRGKVVRYEGREYTLCEPTPQRKDLRPGEALKGVHDGPYEISYAYRPSGR
jgi:hypothetical protein